MTDHEPPPDDGTLTPPNDIQAEMHTIGGMLLSRESIDECLEIVTGPEFYRPAHEVIFTAIAGLHLDGQRVDVVTVADEMTKLGVIGKAGGPGYLHSLVAAVASPASASYYARIVAERAILRRIIEAGTKVQALGYSLEARGGDVDTIVAAAQAEVDTIAAGRVTELRAAADDVDSVIAGMGQGNFLETPWPSMNRTIHGLVPGRVYVVGARPGCGKSIMGVNFAIWWMQRHRKAVALSSLEMPREEVITRSLSQMSGVEFGKFQTGQLSEYERRQVAAAQQQLKSMPPLWIDDRTSIDPSHVRQHARQAARRSDLGLIVVDYLGLMESPRPSENRQQEVARFSRQMKKLARTMEVPVIVLSQLNRGLESRGVDSPPRLSDLRDSGAVEQDADVVFLLHRSDPQSEDVKVLVGKNRQGPMDAFPLTFDGARMRMTEPSREAMTA